VPMDAITPKLALVARDNGANSSLTNIAPASQSLAGGAGFSNSDLLRLARQDR
jgi:hypothetical protein